MTTRPAIPLCDAVDGQKFILITVDKDKVDLVSGRLGVLAKWFDTDDLFGKRNRTVSCFVQDATLLSEPANLRNYLSTWADRLVVRVPVEKLRALSFEVCHTPDAAAPIKLKKLHASIRFSRPLKEGETKETIVQTFLSSLRSPLPDNLDEELQVSFYPKDKIKEMLDQT